MDGVYLPLLTFPYFLLPVTIHMRLHAIAKIFFVAIATKIFLKFDQGLTNPMQTSRESHFPLLMAAVRWREENSLQVNRAFLEEQDHLREMMSVENVCSLLNAKARLSKVFMHDTKN